MEIEDHCCKECESGVYPKDLLDVSEANSLSRFGHLPASIFQIFTLCKNQLASSNLLAETLDAASFLGKERYIDL